MNIEVLMKDQSEKNLYEKLLHSLSNPESKQKLIISDHPIESKDWKIIILSNSDQPKLDQFSLPLRKPFSLDELRRLVTLVLGRESQKLVNRVSFTHSVLGGLSRGLIHQILNTITVLNRRSTQVSREALNLQNNDKILELVQQLKDSAKTVSTLLSEWRELTKSSETQTEFSLLDFHRSIFELTNHLTKYTEPSFEFKEPPSDAVGYGYFQDYCTLGVAALSSTFNRSAQAPQPQTTIEYFFEKHWCLRVQTNGLPLSHAYFDFLREGLLFRQIDSELLFGLPEDQSLLQWENDHSLVIHFKRKSSD